MKEQTSYHEHRLQLAVLHKAQRAHTTDSRQHTSRALRRIILYPEAVPTLSSANAKFPIPSGEEDTSSAAKIISGHTTTFSTTTTRTTTGGLTPLRAGSEKPKIQYLQYGYFSMNLGSRRIVERKRSSANSELVGLNLQYKTTSSTSAGYSSSCQLPTLHEMIPACTDSYSLKSR